MEFVFKTLDHSEQINCLPLYQQESRKEKGDKREKRVENGDNGR